MRAMTMTRIIGVAGTLALSPWASASELSARIEVERDLRAEVRGEPALVEVFVEGPADPDHVLHGAELWLDGVPLKLPPPDRLRGERRARAFLGRVVPGAHLLRARLVVAQERAPVFSYMKGTQWKVFGKALFEAQAGLKLTIHVRPELDSRVDPTRRFTLGFGWQPSLLTEAELEAATASAGEQVPSPSAAPEEREVEAPLATALITVQGRGRPIAAEVKLKRPDGAAQSFSTQGDALLISTPEGRVELEVTAKGFLPSRRILELSSASQTTLSVELMSEAAVRALVRLGGPKGRLLFAQPITFAERSAELSRGGQATLDVLLHALTLYGVDRIRIVGHTDNRGSTTFKREISEARANLVADYLMARGLERQRIELEAVADRQPIKPNLTPKGRAANRRVEVFVARPVD